MPLDHGEGGLTLGPAGGRRRRVHLHNQAMSVFGERVPDKQSLAAAWLLLRSSFASGSVVEACNACSNSVPDVGGPFQSDTRTIRWDVLTVHTKSKVDAADNAATHLATTSFHVWRLLSVLPRPSAPDLQIVHSEHQSPQQATPSTVLGPQGSLPR